METWNLFTDNDLALAFVGLVGFASVVAVLTTAFRTMNKRERTAQEYVARIRELAAEAPQIEVME